MFFHQLVETLRSMRVVRKGLNTKITNDVHSIFQKQRRENITKAKFFIQ